jgi:CysZ protein
MRQARVAAKVDGAAMTSQAIGTAMTDLPRAFALSLGQLSDPAIGRVLAKSILLTLVIFLVLGFAAWAGLSAVMERFAAGYAEFSALLAVVLTLIGGWLLFRVVALAVLQFFADDVVRAVERRHYGSAAQVPDLPWSAELSASFKGLLRVIAVNAVVLPIALVLLVTGIGTALLLWAANGWLLGRELTEMVWLRHRSDASELVPVGGITRFALGGIVAALLIVPVINLLAPVLGAAAATHLIHRARSRHA